MIKQRRRKKKKTTYGSLRIRLINQMNSESLVYTYTNQNPSKLYCVMFRQLLGSASMIYGQ